MFLGHYGLALAAKRVAPRESLGATVTASQWADLLWPIFLIVGWEQVRIVPGLMAASSLEFVHYPITHSLLAVVGWAILLGTVSFLFTRRATGSLVLGALVVSHWLLDLPVHEPDLPLWPGSDILLGGGLWNSLPLTLILEFGIFLGGLALYTRATTPRDGAGRWGLWTMILVLSLFYLSSFAAPPPSETALAYGGLTLWVFVPWAYWVDKHRVVRESKRVENQAE
jgi:membrane-bound metal-dependent hydrolase YbcI (DUF457 family)